MSSAAQAAGPRMVVKVGSSSLTTAAGGLDADRLDALVDALAAARSRGDQVVLVSSGAIAAGLAPLALDARPTDLARQQAVASVGQGLLMARYTASCARHGIRVGQVLLTNDAATRTAHFRNAHRTLEALLALGVLPIVNENDTVATDEIRFGDNDRLAALVAELVHADRLILLSDVDGLYDAHPRDPGSRRITQVRDARDLDGLDLAVPGSPLGTGGMAAKVAAARAATAAGIPVLLTAAARAADALLGTADTGTLFHPAAVNPLTDALENIVTAVLEIPATTPHDNFQDLGGNSLQAMRICARIRKETGIRVAPQDLFDSASLAEFFSAVTGSGGAQNVA